MSRAEPPDPGSAGSKAIEGRVSVIRRVLQTIMSTHTNMFAKDDDVQDFVVFPSLPLLLETSADFERVQNVTVDVVPFSPPPGSIMLFLLTKL